MNAAAEDIWKILQEIAQTQKENKLEFREIALRFKETDLRFKKTGLGIEKVNQIVGRLSNKLGEYVASLRCGAAVSRAGH